MAKNEARKNSGLETMIFGKIPPQATDMEQAVLGAIMQFRDGYDQASAILKPECFYKESHRRIFEVICELAFRNQPIDILTVVEALKKNEQIDLVGGAFYVTSLTNQVSSPGHTEAHCRIIFQKYIQRELIRIGGEIVSNSYEDGADPFDLLSEAEQMIANIGTKSVFGDMVGIDRVLVEAIQQIEEWRRQDTTITGIPSGFPKLDRVTRGWQNGDLIIIAARPSTGKTAFMLNVMRHAARHFNRKKTAKVWSLEMKSLRLVLRLLAAEARELLGRIQTGRLDDDQMKRLYERGVQQLARLLIYFDDESSLPVRKLKAKAKKKMGGVETGIVFVDYLQLMDSEGRDANREQEVSKISRGLKRTALEMNIPVIALSQLSRDIEKRATKSPQLSDLRESGSIEQDADVVIFLYGPTEAEVAEDPSLQDRIYIKVAKQRDGMLDTIELDFKTEYQLFEEIDKMITPDLPGNWRPVSLDFTEPKKDQS
jgi:replicative DNA helicase